MLDDRTNGDITGAEYQKSQSRASLAEEKLNDNISMLKAHN
jgi:hypothetical protein